MNLVVKYPLSMRVLHWLISISILTLTGVGWYMAGLPNEAPDKFDLYPLHKSFGMLVLLLVTLRLANRLRSTVPPLPAVLAGWEKTAAQLAQLLLYILMFAVPLMGYTMSSAGGHAVPFFGIDLPLLIDKNKAVGGFAHQWHEWLAYTMLALVGLHAAGALKHRLVDRAKGGDVLSRML